jgi:hypothetical protein
MRKVDIFYKTYTADIPWLKKSLETLRAHWTGYRKVVVVCPPEDERAVRCLDRDIHTIAVDEGGARGYIFQQAVKLNAHHYTDADYIVFCDSDCMWIKPTTPATYIKPSGKPELLYTPYENVPEAQQWKAPTERALKREVFAEFMRRHPAVYHKKTLHKMDQWFLKEHGLPASQFMLQFGPDWGLSEFNLMGAWAWYHAHEDFHWVNTTKDTWEPDHLKQYWSYGGVGQLN